MEMEASEDYSASNGQCSPGKENSRMLVDMSAPNGQTAPPGPNSPSEIKIKQEEEMAEKEDSSDPTPEEMGQMVDDGVSLEESTADSPSHAQDGLSGANQSFDGTNRQPNGERPFQCNQCGVSFTQKGNLLRHIKLHTGEKPFKCPFCNYACRRRDALTGHLRTHAVGKPHKCNYCGRSYKQRTSLEEHKERCHSYLQGIGLDPGSNTGTYPEVPKEARPTAEANAMATYERPPVIEKLNSNLGKRKSTTPQKFVGEKLARYSYPDLGYEIGPKFEKQAEMLPPHMMDQAINDAMTYLGTNNLRPLLHHPGPPLSMTEVMPMINPMYHPAVMSLGHRTECRGNSETLPPQPSHFLNHPTSNGPSNALTRQSKSLQSAQEESPSNSGIDSADSARSSPQDKQSYHGSTVPPGLRSRGSPAVHCSNDRAPDVSPKSGGRPGAGVMRIPAERSASNEGVRVFGREGNELRAFQCEHCQVLFLDHVMYTIHMGCHGYRDPLECNICGHQSKDRYEFSSHIVRGEHTFH